MRKFIAFVLSLVTILSFTAFASYAESSDVTYDVLDNGALIFSGNYNRKENKIEIHGNIQYDVLVTYKDCRMEFYKLLPNQNINSDIFGNEDSIVASMDIAVNFSLSFVAKSSVDRFCRYFVVFCSPEGERIVASKPQYLDVEANYDYSKNANKYFKGICDDKKNTSVYSDVGAGTVIIPVYYNKLLNSMSNGYLYHHEKDYCYFDREYIDGLSATIRSYSASGARVYLQLLMPIENLSDSEGNLKYAMPDVYSNETISLTCTYVSYLASKFDRYTEGKISGFIVGDSIDIKNQNYSNEYDLDEYAKKYAYYLTIVSNAARCENPDLDIVVPISGCNSFYDEYQSPEGMFPSSKLIEAISYYISRNCTEPLKFSLMIDTEKAVLKTETDSDGNTVCVPYANDTESIGADNIGILTKYITNLGKKYTSVPDNIIYKWSVSEELGGNILCASYSYLYYSLFANSKVSAFVVSFEKARSDAFDSVKRLMSNIDTESESVESQKVLPLFGVDRWEEIIDKYTNKGLVIKTRYDSNNHQPNHNHITGAFSYVNFSLGNIRDFYGGAFSKSIKTDFGINGHRVLKQNVYKADGALHTDLFGLFEYNENYIYTPDLKIDVGISESGENSGALYEVKAVIGNSSSSVERTCIVKSGEIYSIWLDMREFNASSNLSDYIRISTRSITGTESEYSVLLYDVCGYSTEKNSEELNTLISEERARIRMQYDAENTVSKDKSLYQTVFIILIIAILSIGVLFVILRRDDDKK